MFVQPAACDFFLFRFLPAIPEFIDSLYKSDKMEHKITNERKLLIVWRRQHHRLKLYLLLLVCVQ